MKLLNDPYKNLFQRRQQELLFLANTTGFRYLMNIKDNFPIVKITKDSVHMWTGEYINARPAIKAVFWPGKPVYKRLIYPLIKMDIMKESYGPILNYDEAFEHFADLQVNRRRYPLIMLTTTTFYPDPGDPGTTSCDGEVRGPAGPDTWANMRDGSGASATTNTATGRAYISAHNVSNQFSFFWRTIHLYDTSSIGSGQTITAGVNTLAFVCNSKNDDFSDSIDTSSCAPGSNTTLAASDYNIANMGGTSFGSKTIASVTADGATYNSITLNSSGDSNISKTGISKFTYRFSADVTNSAYTWSSSLYSNITFLLADTAGTTTDPKLTVTYTTTVAAAPSSRTLLGVGN